MPEYDVAIIGSGPGGYVAAIRAAQLGLKAAVIEKDNVGGLCLNWGCIPSKALLYSAELINLFQRGPEFGIGFENLTADLSVSVNRSRDVVARFVSGVEQLFVQNKVTLIKGTATVNSPTSVRVEPSGEIVQAKNIIVAAGGFTRSLPNVAIDGVNIITSREALELRDRPASIVIVGGGAIGVEFGYLYKSFGA
ncbi:MAG: FAD-dependent oxidoreductase, partial [Dehalococcoidia bacterium]